MHPLNGALPGPYVPVRVTRGALAAEPHSITGLLFSYHDLGTWNDLGGPIFDGVGLAGFKSRANAW